MDTFKNQLRKQVNTGSGTLWALIGKPAGFETTGEKYPVIVFIHGSGETGKTADDTAKLCAYGPSYLIASGDTMEVVNRRGQTVKFLTLAIQQQSVTYTSLSQILYVIDNDEVLKNRVSEIFVTGLSLGAQSIFESHWKDTDVNLARITGFAPFSGDWYSSLDPLLTRIASIRVPVALYWGTKENSYVIYGSRRIPAVLNAANAGQVVTATQDAGHCCWNVPYSRSFQWGAYSNLYEWFASWVKVAEVPAEPQYKVTDMVPGKIKVEGKPITATTVLNLGGVELEYVVK